MNRKKHTFKAAIVSDRLFPAKVMYAINIRYQCWLSECKRASGRCEVNDRIIDLTEIINDISNSCFFVEPPSSFKSSTNSMDARSSGGTGSSQEGGHKRRGDNEEKDNGKKRHVQNKNQIEEFKIREGESWKNGFCGKCVDACPIWKGNKREKMYPRWHSKETASMITRTKQATFQKMK